jgi:hypothetical protein
VGRRGRNEARLRDGDSRTSRQTDPGRTACFLFRWCVYLGDASTSIGRRQMPGGGSPIPTRPHKLFSFSAERVRYSCGGGVEGLIFGLVFSSAGAFCLVMAGWCLLSLFGVPLPQQAEPDPSLLGILVPVLMLFAVGSGFSVAGFGFLCTFRTTLDRQRDEVVVRSGWLGFPTPPPDNVTNNSPPCTARLAGRTMYCDYRTSMTASRSRQFVRRNCPPGADC